MSRTLIEPTASDDISIVDIKEPRSFTPPPRHSDGLVALGIFAITLVLRLVFAARQPTEWDSVHYIRGLDHFNVVEYWPHAPGYWLYIFEGRLIRWLSPLSAYSSLLLATAIASAATVAIAYLIGRKVANRQTGLVCAAVLMTMPFMWYYGAIVTTKSFDSLGLMLMLLLAYRTAPNSKIAPLACAVLGLTAGVRQSALLMFAPILIYILICCIRSVRQFLLSAIAGAVALAAWIVPMSLEQPGGISVIRQQSNILFQGAIHQTSVLVGAPGAKANMLQVAGVVLAALIPLVLFVLITAGTFRASKNRWTGWKLWLPLLLVTLPGVFEALAITFGTPGYSLSFLPGLVMIVLLPLGRFSQTRFARTLLISATVVVVGFQADRYLFATNVVPTRVAQASDVWANNAYGAPYNETYAGIKALDQDQLKYRAISQQFDPNKDVLIYDNSNGGYRYRIAGYQLPAFSLDLINAGEHIDEARDGRHLAVGDSTVSVPSGGEAILVLDSLPDDLKPLLGTGQIQQIQLTTGPTVWALKPGNNALGLHFVNGPLPSF